MHARILGLLLLSISFSLLASEAKDASCSIRIHPNGSISIIPKDPERSLVQASLGKSTSLFFGMPEKAPQKRWREMNSLPIYHTMWEDGNIRYTQSVMLVPLTGYDLTQPISATISEVLLVRIKGDCLATEYTEARAAFIVKQDQPISLTLLEDLVVPRGQTNSPPLALIDLPSGGNPTFAEGHLQFKANMPPSESGGMTIKIPLCSLKGEEAIKLLRQLDFNDELSSAKKFWIRKLKEGGVVTSPIEFVARPNSD